MTVIDTKYPEVTVIKKTQTISQWTGILLTVTNPDEVVHINGSSVTAEHTS